MDAAANEREGQALHGMVSARLAWGVCFAACVAIALVTGISGGLLRVGVLVPGAADTAWLPRAALAHAALMICGFMGTVIGIERAVAAKHRLAWLAPASSGLAALAMLAGADSLARWLLVLAGGIFTAVNVFLLRKQPANHTALLVGSAAACTAGSLLFALDAPPVAVLPWWFVFLVTTIAAERLEMTRLMRRRKGALPALLVVLAALAGGAVLSGFNAMAGGVLFGAALLALSTWLLVFDIARRTVRAEGLSRYMAICLLTGYVWLAIGGVAWAATALGSPARDAALHALGLGFIFSMIMGHAPVILPAIARLKLQFGRFFYVPLAALHLSLAWRLAGEAVNFSWRAAGAALNAVAIALFLLTVVGAVVAWRRAH